MKKIFIALMLTLVSINVVSAAQQKQTGTSTQKVEKVVDPSKDTNPVIGTIEMSDKKEYRVYQGPRGGKYIYWTATKGEKQGQLIRRNLNKKEQERIKPIKK